MANYTRYKELIDLSLTEGIYRTNLAIFILDFLRTWQSLLISFMNYLKLFSWIIELQRIKDMH